MDPGRDLADRAAGLFDHDRLARDPPFEDPADANLDVGEDLLTIPLGAHGTDLALDDQAGSLCELRVGGHHSDRGRARPRDEAPERQTEEDGPEHKSLHTTSPTEGCLSSRLSRRGPVPSIHECRSL